MASFQVDIYSLGIILFEFYQPFKTEMEKHKTIKEVREGVIDEDFKTRWAKQVSTGLKETAILLKDCWNGCWCVERLYGGIIFYSYNNFVSI